MEGERAVLRAVTDQIVYRIMRLSGQRYSDVYASTVRNRLARAE
jgi:1-acyl-sn-glycerol-3-phosphate acyltransferase